MARCRIVWFGPNFQRVPAKTVRSHLTSTRGLHNPSWIMKKAHEQACHSGMSNPAPNYTAVKVNGPYWKPSLEVSRIMRQRYGRKGTRRV